jgi:NAD(P)H dehydrogenase (quinone)
MKATVLLAHPYAGSFNHAIFDRLNQRLSHAGVSVFAHDLYAEGFDPVLTVGELGKEPAEDPLVVRYASELMESKLIFFVHPNWWGQPPAIMKGYIDRVIRPPYAYDMDAADPGGLPVPKLGGKTGVVYNTSNTPAEREEGYFGDPLERIWKRCVFGFCGIEDYRRRMFRIVSDSTAEQRRGWLEEIDGDVEELVSAQDSRRKPDRR